MGQMYTVYEMDVITWGPEGRWWQVKQWPPQALKNVQFLIPDTYEYVTLCDKRDSQIWLRIFEIGDCFGLSEWIQYSCKGPYNHMSAS